MPLCQSGILRKDEAQRHQRLQIPNHVRQGLVLCRILSYYYVELRALSTRGTYIFLIRSSRSFPGPFLRVGFVCGLSSFLDCGFRSFGGGLTSFGFGFMSFGRGLTSFGCGFRSFGCGCRGFGCGCFSFGCHVWVCPGACCSTKELLHTISCHQAKLGNAFCWRWRCFSCCFGSIAFALSFGLCFSFCLCFSFAFSVMQNCVSHLCKHTTVSTYLQAKYLLSASSLLLLRALLL